MTKGGSSKSKTLGRLIFGDKRKPQASPAQHRSLTRNVAPKTDTAAPVGTTVEKAPINLQDWAVWRIQLNEQMASAVGDIRADLKQMRHFLQSNSFYQQHCHDSSNRDQSNSVQLLFSIPRANINPELLEDLQELAKSAAAKNELEEPIIYEEDQIRSPSHDRTTSVNSTSVIQPAINDIPISQLLPKSSITNTNECLPSNEPIHISDRIHPRRSIRRSFVPTDRINGTLQKAVKDGNVLEKIKAFEKQAAAAQAEYTGKLHGTNFRMQSVTSSIQSATQHRLSPAVVHPIKSAVSPLPVQNQKQPSIRVSRGRHVHPMQQQPSGNYDSTADQKSRKGAHVLEPAHGDIILKRRTPSQKTANDEDCSITAITSVPLTASQAHHRTSAHHNYYHHRKSASRSRHRHDAVYEKRPVSKNEHSSHKHHHKSKERATTSGKSSTHRRWLKGRKGATTEASNQGENKQSSTKQSDKTNTSKKKKNDEQEKHSSKKTSKSVTKEKVVADNNRVYGVPSTNADEPTKTESPLQTTLKNEEKHELDSKHDTIDNLNTLISSKKDNLNQTKESDIAIQMKIQRRSSRNSHKQKPLNAEEEIINKVIDENRFCRLTAPAPPHHTEFNDRNEDDDNEGEIDYDKSDDDVFIQETPMKSKPNIVRHQSVVHLPNSESRRFQQLSSCIALRRHASQYSTNEVAYEKRFQHTKENSELIVADMIKKKPPPITIITRKHRLTQNEQMSFEIPQSEPADMSLSNSHTLKKKRPSNNSNLTGTAMNHPGQNNNNNNNKQVSKQILHAIMNSMNNQDQPSIGPPAIAFPSSVNDEFFENGPLTNPEETLVNMTNIVAK